MRSAGHPPTQELELQMCTTMPNIHVGAGDLHSDHHVCSTGTLPTEPSLHLLKYFKTGQVILTVSFMVSWFVSAWRPVSFHQPTGVHAFAESCSDCGLDLVTWFELWELASGMGSHFRNWDNTLHTLYLYCPSPALTCSFSGLWLFSDLRTVTRVSGEADSIHFSCHCDQILDMAT